MFWQSLQQSGISCCHLVSCCCDFSKMLIPRPEISAEQLSKRRKNSFKWDFPPDEVWCAEQTVRGLHRWADGWCRQALRRLIPGEAAVNFCGEICSLVVHIYTTCLVLPNEPQRTGSTQTWRAKNSLNVCFYKVLILQRASALDICTYTYTITWCQN